ncbi:WD repeat-containing protein 35 [Lobulomyces angularis]|nr:WD repeat-containing protein 35 [Lobulomyces angularis]
MFVYLSKKIAIPNNVRLCSIAWNNDQGWIACGGEDGLLKVLKLEQNTANQSTLPSIAASERRISNSQNVNNPTSPTLQNSQEQQSAPSNLTMNQTLEGHKGGVVVSTWNTQHRKLTTSDSMGLIIVWILYKGVWYEEMINNRNKSVVTDMHWNRDGQKICIVYEDGAVIVGSVDGNRLWGKDLKGQTLTNVQWSPDSKSILFGTATGELLLYDMNGNYLTKTLSYCHENAAVIKLSSIEWYNGINGYIEPKVPCLAICFENGKIQIMRDEKDMNPTIVDTNMRYLKMKWNNNGSVLAVSGVQIAKNAQGEEKELSIVRFYSPYGEFQRFLKVPGKRISSLSWEHNGLRIALAVDSFIYFANVRPDHKWTFFANDVLVYTYNRLERTETIVVFWNTKTGEKFAKYLNQVYFITSNNENCLIVTRSEENSEKYNFSIYNAIGTSVESKEIDFEPKSVSINKSHVFISSNEIVVDWQFKILGVNNTPQINAGAVNKFSALDALRRKETKERAFHIDDNTIIGNSSDSGQSVADVKQKQGTTDPIISTTASEKYLILIRSSGEICQYILPSLNLENKFNIYKKDNGQNLIKVFKSSLNSTSTRLLILDYSGILKMVNLESRLKGSSNAEDSQRLMDFEKKDVCDIRWAEDNEELFAVIEKTRMFVFRNYEPEDPIPCSGYTCHFSDLQIKVALMDEILSENENGLKESIITIETKRLRDAKNILSQSGLSEAVLYVEANPHPKLWKVIAEASLSSLDLNTAQKAFVRSSNYQGLQFVKKLRKIEDRLKQRAEVAAYFCNFDLAEKIYLEMDRKDLAIDLRCRLGDWFRVVQLIKSGGGISAADDMVLDKIRKNIGDYYYDRQRWVQAVTYYSQGKDMENLAECYYLLEDYVGLDKLAFSATDNHPLLKKIAKYFSSVGMCDQAVDCYLNAGDIKAAVDVCVHLNQWSRAIELAKLHKFKEIEALLANYANYLLDRNKVLNAIELYRKANYCQKSARLLFQLAKSTAKQNKSPLLVKKLYVLAAMEIEHYNHINKNTMKVGEGYPSIANKGNSDLIKKDENPWRGAEAYHFYILSQRQYYSGNLDGALKTVSVLILQRYVLILFTKKAFHLQEYEDTIDPKIIYSLLAFLSAQCKHFGTCSKAFIKLEALNSSNGENSEQEDFENLAFNIFTK